MTPKEIDIPTLEWMANEIAKDSANHKQWKTRTDAYIAALDHTENTIRCVISRVQRGEGLHPVSSLMDMSQGKSDISSILEQGE